MDLDAEKRLAGVLVDAARDGLVGSAHDLSDGGLAQALAESCLLGAGKQGIGARVSLPDDLDPFVALFSESTARAVVAVPAADAAAFTDLCDARGVPHLRIGVTEGAGPAAVLDVDGQFSVPLSELREAWSATLPTALG